MFEIVAVDFGGVGGRLVRDVPTFGCWVERDVDGASGLGSCG